MDAQPLSLDEWMGAVQNAHLVIETKKAHLRETQRVDRSEVRTTYYPRTPSSTSTPTYRSGSAVQVKRVGVEGDDNDNATRDEPGNEEEVQKAEVSRTTSRPATQERLGSHLTFQQRERLRELGRCWICIGRGHRAYDCDKRERSGIPASLLRRIEKRKPGCCRGKAVRASIDQHYSSLISISSIPCHRVQRLQSIAGGLSG